MVQTVPDNTPNAFEYILDLVKPTNRYDVLAVTSSLTKGLGSVEAAHKAGIRSLWISA